MRPIELPWTTVLGQHSCFGCSQTNSVGLRLTFHVVDDALQTTFTLDQRYESYPGVVHGGIITTVADEVMGNHLVLNGHGLYFTSAQKTRFLAPARTLVEYICRSRVSATHDIKTMKASADIIRASDGEVIAMSDATYHQVSPRAARETMAVDIDVLRQPQHHLDTSTQKAGTAP
jgi:acyl-coenzyme A thioesterase PaaI-like protein